jgi:hypothetical protein
MKKHEMPAPAVESPDIRSDLVTVAAIKTKVTQRHEISINEERNFRKGSWYFLCTRLRGSGSGLLFIYAFLC